MNWKALENFVKNNSSKINQTEWNRICEVHKSNPNLDVDTYMLVHGHELMAVDDTRFSDEEENQIKNELKKYAQINIFDYMEKDENCRDDLKIELTYNGESKVIWYLKMFNGESVEYNCLYPKINHNYYDFEALIKDIPSVLNTENPF